MRLSLHHEFVTRRLTRQQRKIPQHGRQERTRKKIYMLCIPYDTQRRYENEDNDTKKKRRKTNIRHYDRTTDNIGNNLSLILNQTDHQDVFVFFTSERIHQQNNMLCWFFFFPISIRNTSSTSRSCFFLEIFFCLHTQH